MMSTTRDGRSWIPSFLESIDADACIGCGRCYKACGRGVMEPVEREDDEDDEGPGGIIMTVADPGACIGCEACARSCAKRAHRHAAA